MQEITTKAIVIDCKDYKEKDKLITLFSLEYGFLTAVIKSVKDEKAKLKFAKELFCFAEYNLVGQDIKTVTSANVIDTFYDISKDYERYEIACKILKVLKNQKLYTEPNIELFLLVVKSLKSLCYNKEVNTTYIWNKFMIDYLTINGYKLNLVKCANCKCQLYRAYICMSTGELVCPSCKNDYCVEIDNQTRTSMRILNDTGFEDLSRIKLFKDSEKKVCKLLETNIKIFN